MSASPPDPDRPANRLAGETSPYLLQHAHNPVDWHPWGPEALQKAHDEDRPIFLSVGYSACHWCHVMERESFEEPKIAALMNEHFVNIKVDREERPDLDQIYMAAVQAITGHGGWPMSVFLTPDLQPFFGGTYYPPVDGRGMPSFPRVLLGVASAWKERRGEILTSAAEMTRQLSDLGALPPDPGELSTALLDGAFRSLSRAFDPIHGGFGSAPKFPHPMDLKVLLRHHARTGDSHALHMVRQTLDKMARGGIYDHLGGGFARYSTDDRWLAPHFEKMLYDNALLAQVYVEAFQVTRDPEYARVALETLDYVLGRMTAAEGGFCSTEDADSEGVEGKFYVWTLTEIVQLLGAELARTFAYVYDVSEGGNWEGHTILNLPKPLEQAARLLGRGEAELRRELDQCRERLLAARELRIPPAKDTKVLTSWNGLMLATLAQAAHALDEPRYADAASRAAGFLLGAMRTPDGRLLHSHKDGRARFNGYLDDSANLIDGLTRLFEATGEGRWVEASVELAEGMLAEFADPDGGFFYTGARHETLIARQKDLYDNATPSASAMASTALLRLAALTGRDDFQKAGMGVLRSARALMDRAPAAAGQLLVALDFALAPPREYAVVAGHDPAEVRDALGAIASRFEPSAVVAPSMGGTSSATADRTVPLLANRPAREGRVTTYVCERFACQEPVVGVEALRELLARPSEDASHG